MGGGEVTERGVSREELNPSWGSALRRVFSIHSDLVPHCAQNFLEVGGKRTIRGRFCPQQRLWNPLDSTGTGEAFPEASAPGQLRALA